MSTAPMTETGKDMVNYCPEWSRHEEWDQSVADVEAEAVAAERARIAEAVRGLEGQCHSHSGLYCDASPCVENVSREEVLAIVAES